MTLQDYLEGEFTGKAKRGDRGKESDWLEFSDLTVRGSKVQVVDSSYVPDEREGCMVTLTPGLYQVQAKAMAYGEDVRISRLRVVLHGVSPSAGAELGETGTDTASIGVCDHEVFAHAWGDDNDASWEIISPAIDEADTHGIAVLDKAAGAIMPFIHSGFGDGTFPVRELLANGSRVGFEVVFIRSDEPFPF